MAQGTWLETTATGTVLFLLVLLQAALVWDEVSVAPAKRNDILAGTEFLSVFINGAMATQPPVPRRRGFRRGNQASVGDNVPAESRQNEASIYRISRLPVGRTMVTRPQAHGNGRDEVVRFYPISQKTLENRKQNLASLIDDLGTSGHLSPTNLTPQNTRTSVSSGDSSPSSTNLTKNQSKVSDSNDHSANQNGSNNVTSGIINLSNEAPTNGAKPDSGINSDGNSEEATVFNSSETPNGRPKSDYTADNAVNSGKGYDKPAGGLNDTKINGNNTTGQRIDRPVNHQKVIGVSVTSTVEATPYKVRVEHYDNGDIATMTRPPSYDDTFSTDVVRETTAPSARQTSTSSSIVKSSISASTTILPARLVTEELNNIVSESNRSEFSVDEGLPNTNWHGRGSATARSTIRRASTHSHRREDGIGGKVGKQDDVTLVITATEPVEVNYELPEENSEPRESHEEPEEEVTEQFHLQGRKAGRHYDSSSHYNEPGTKAYGQSAKPYGKASRTYGEPAKVYGEPAKVYGEPEKVYGEPARVYSEPAKVYSELAKVYGEPAKIYSEPAKVYGEPEKVYSEPSKVYSEPAKIYSEPAKIYSEPAKVYGEPSKVYDSNGQPVDHEEPHERNYEIDESVSVGSNGNVHGPQLVVTEPPTTEVEDGHKVGYVVEGRNYRKYRVEERTPDGFIVGEYGVVSHDDGTLRGVRYTADGTINPRLIYDALMKFLAL